MTTKLRTEPRIPDPDAFYKALADLHEHVSPEESLLLNAKLVFVLANHIGDKTVLMEALAAVKAGDMLKSDKHVG